MLEPFLSVAVRNKSTIWHYLDDHLNLVIFVVTGQ